MEIPRLLRCPALTPSPRLVSAGPLIKFESRRLRVTEPAGPGEPVTVRVAVVRLGDLGNTSVTRLYTRDGSARAGSDYHGVSRGEAGNRLTD